MSRPRACGDDTLLLVAASVRGGLSYRALADLLTVDGVPTPGGRVRWFASTITKLLQTAAGAAVRDAADPEAALAAYLDRIGSEPVPGDVRKRVPAVASEAHPDNDHN